MKVKHLLLIAIALLTVACKNTPKEAGKEAAPAVSEERTDLLTETETANVMLWMRKKPDIIKLYNNKGNDGAEGLTSNADFKKRLTNYHKVDIGDIRLMDYELKEDGTQLWTYRIITFMGNDTKVFVGNAGFKGKAFVPGEKIFDWVKTSQLNPSVKID